MLHRGKRPATPSPHDFQLVNYADMERVAAATPKPVPHDTGFALGMYGNGPDDTVRPGFGGAGDCVFAAICELLHLSQHAVGTPLAPLTGREAIAAYSEVTGYVIGDESTDQGTDMGEALAWLRKTGIADATGKRHKALAYLSLTPKSHAEKMAALYYFGAADIGIAFPDYAMDEFNAGRDWNYEAGKPAPQDGHCIPIVRASSTRKWQIYSWDRELGMSTTFDSHYEDEAFAIIFEDYFNAQTHLSPEGFDSKKLLADLATL